MKHVEFITIEDETDLIVSFAIAPSAHRSLTLLRSPQYEFLFLEYERCVYVSFDPSEPDDDPLLSVHWGKLTVTVKTVRHVYQLDISAVDEIEITGAKTVLLRKLVKDVAKYIECD
jgi:hypothetical protein